MTNTNCLAGVKCPSCESTASFDIEATCLVTVTDDGTDNPRHFEWGDTSWVTCNGCGYVAMLSKFKSDTTEDEDG